MDATTGEVVIKSTIDQLREQVGHENLFTLTFIAKEVGDEETASTIGGPSAMSGRKMDGGEIERLVDGLNVASDLPNEADSHNHYIVNDHYYDDESDRPVAKRRPISSPLASDLLAIDSQISDRVGHRAGNSASDSMSKSMSNSVSNSVNDRVDDNVKYKNPDINAFSKRTDRAESLASLQSINHHLLNRTPLKSTPVNVPPLSPMLFSRRMLPEPVNSLPSPEHPNYFGSFEDPFKPLVNLTTREVKRAKEPIGERPDRAPTNQPTTGKATVKSGSSSTTNRPSARPATTSSPTTSRPVTTSRPPIISANTAKPFFVTSKPMPVKSTTSRPVETLQTTTVTSKTSSTKSTTTSTQSPWKPMAKALPSVVSRPIQWNAPLIAQNAAGSSSAVRTVNLVNDNLVADEHYIVNNLTSIGMMDENFKPENLIEPESSAEISRFNNERATMMNAVLSEISGASRTESEITIGFVILQISNHAPEFPLVKPNFTGDTPLFILYGQIDDDLKPASAVQLEHELLVQDREHGLNGTFDVHLMDPTKTFDVQPKTGYRNQTFQIIVTNSSQLNLLGNKMVNMKVGIYLILLICHILFEKALTFVTVQRASYRVSLVVFRPNKPQFKCGIYHTKRSFPTRIFQITNLKIR